MKIAGILLLEQVLTGGTKRYIDLMNGLAKHNDVIIFVNEAIAYEFSNCTTIPINLKFDKTKRISVQQKVALKNYLARNFFATVDYVIVFGETDIQCALLIKKKLKTEIVFCYRSSIIDENNAILKYGSTNLKAKIKLVLEKLITLFREFIVSRKAKLIMFQTDFDKNNFLHRNKTAANKCHIIPNDILRPRFTEELKNKNLSEDCRKILYVGNYTKRKGFEILIEAASLLIADNIHITCSVIALQEPPFEIKQKIKVKKLEKFFLFLPPTKNVMEVMIEHDLVVVPSLFDSYPNVIMEALHTGTPVLASNCSGMPYMLPAQDLLFEAGNPASLAEKIKVCVLDNDYYKSVKKTCIKRRTFFEFDWVAEWEKVLR
ncbi:MAG: glycosyltransferase family 4 protein, partial [Treponemataceae bacterium]